MMETITLEDNIQIMYIGASSFPDGVLAAHQQLHSLITFSTDRKYYGVSRPENKVITYKAAAEEKQEHEAEELNLKTMVLEKGNYICLTVKDFMEDLQGIGKAFNQLLTTPNLDPNGYCVEWYLNDKDVMCMIRLQD